MRKIPCELLDAVAVRCAAEQAILYACDLWYVRQLGAGPLQSQLLGRVEQEAAWIGADCAREVRDLIRTAEQTGEPAGDGEPR